MKTCPYCGKEYPDNASICELDQNLLVYSKPKSINPPNATDEQTLSSVQTFYVKFFVPTMWFFGLGGMMLAIFFGAFPDDGNKPKPSDWLWFLTMWILGFALIWWRCARLKKVRIDSSAIYVSNYLKEVRIPLEEIQEITESRWDKIHPVTIHFRHSTSFGEQIVFMPKWQLWSWKSHPVVKELRGLAHVHTF